MFQKALYILFSICLVTGVTIPSLAQVDPHFSQFYVYPLGLNPGLTGAVDAEYRVSAIYRNQWHEVTKAFSTTGLSADVNTNKNISLGANLFHQTAGSGGYQYINGYLTMAYTGIQLDAMGYKRIGMGLQAGIINRRFDPSKLQFGSQWLPGIGYQPSIPPNEVFDKTSSSAFDAGAGIAYYDGTPDQKINLFGGFSTMHLTQPEDPFLNGVKEKLPVRYTVHAGAKVAVNEVLALVPNFIYMKQGTAQEKMVGGYAQLYLNRDADLMLGSNWRFQDAVTPFVGVYYKNTTIGVSYDMNISPLGKSVKGTNSFELSVTFTGKKRERVDTRQFMCPRL